MTAGGDAAQEKTIFGYAPSFEVTRPGVVTVAFRGSWAHGLEIAVEFLLWLLAVGLLVGRRRSLVGVGQPGPAATGPTGPARRPAAPTAPTGPDGAHGAHGVRRDRTGGGDHGDGGDEAGAVVEGDGVSSGAGPR